MHELSLCQSIGTIVRQHAADRQVQVVHLTVGQLRQVVPETLVYCWGIVNEGTTCEGSNDKACDGQGACLPIGVYDQTDFDASVFAP